MPMLIFYNRFKTRQLGNSNIHCIFLIDFSNCIDLRWISGFNFLFESHNASEWSSVFHKVWNFFCYVNVGMYRHRNLGSCIAQARGRVFEESPKYMWLLHSSTNLDMSLLVILGVSRCEWQCVWSNVFFLT